MTEKRTKKKRGVKIAEYDINGQKLQDLTMTDTTFDGVNDIHVYIQKKTSVSIYMSSNIFA